MAAACAACPREDALPCDQADKGTVLPPARAFLNFRDREQFYLLTSVLR